MTVPRAALEKAIAVEPRLAPAHAALAEAWVSLGYHTRAREAGKRAHELSDGLTREDRLVVEARYHESKNNDEGGPCSIGGRSPAGALLVALLVVAFRRHRRRP